MGKKIPQNPEREHNEYHAQTGDRWTNMNECWERFKVRTSPQFTQSFIVRINM